MMKDRAEFSLVHLSDAELLSSLGAVVGSQRAVMAELIAHLAEVDVRKLYLAQATSSLFVYCVQRLGFSEDEACRRIDAARLVQRFPEISAMLKAGEVSLSVLSRLKATICEENASELLALVRSKTVRETERLLAARCPKPDVPDRIRKLPAVRTDSARPSSVPEHGSRDVAQSEQVLLTVQPLGAAKPTPKSNRGKVVPLSSDRFRIELSGSRAFAEKLERARDLMSHANPDGDLATVIEAALDLLIAEMMKKKFGKTSRPRVETRKAKRTRVTSATRREVVARDGAQCSFVDACGRRCSETRFLELDHERPRALDGSSDAENVRVLCRAHNQGEAERIFGKQHIDRKKRERGFDVREKVAADYRVGFGRRCSVGEIPVRGQLRVAAGTVGHVTLQHVDGVAGSAAAKIERVGELIGWDQTDVSESVLELGPTRRLRAVAGGLIRDADDADVGGPDAEHELAGSEDGVSACARDVLAVTIGEPELVGFADDVGELEVALQGSKGPGADVLEGARSEAFDRGCCLFNKSVRTDISIDASHAGRAHVSGFVVINRPIEADGWTQWRSAGSRERWVPGGMPVAEPECMDLWQRTFGAFLIIGLGAGLTTSGCGEAAEEVDNTVDCAQICHRYSDCFDSNYDVSGCTDTCEDNADVDQTFENKKEACDDCIDDKACSESFSCGSACGGIVP